MHATGQPWGTAPGGEPVTLFTLENAGMRARVTDYGATLVSLSVPDGRGVTDDVVLGYDSLDEYVRGRAYLGATVGRVANRISGAGFMLDGITYELTRNEGENQLHGGPEGFHRRVWYAEPASVDGDPALSLSLCSEDGDQGYPGNLRAEVVYILTDRGLRIEFKAETDRPTPVSMTSHFYFNLAGAGSSDVLDHLAKLKTRRYLAVGPGMIPTGDTPPTDGTPLDFAEPTRIGERIEAPFPALETAGGYDQYCVMDGEPGELRPAARFSEAGSGRTLTVLTTQPGFQFYTGNALDGTQGRNGAVYGPRAGFCVEPSGYVDRPNRPEFPSVILRPGEMYAHATEYRFSA